MDIYLQVLWKRKFVILLTTIITVAIIAVGTYRAESLYTASAKLRVVTYGLDRPDYNTFLYFENLATTFSVILDSFSVEQEARERLEVEELPDYEIAPIPNSELMEILATSPDPEFSQLTANTLAEILVEESRTQFGGVEGIEATLGTMIANMEERIDGLISERADLENRVPRDNARIEQITVEIAREQENYNRLQASYNEAIVAQATRANIVSIIEPAMVPDEPTGMNPIFLMVLGGVAGLAGGVALAFGLENTYPNLYNFKQLESATRSKIIGKIPRIKRRWRNNVFDGDTAASEAFRRLRVNVQTSMQQVSQNTLLVTSPQSESHKATISLNLAISMALSQHRVLLIDGDIRKPSLHERFELANTQGLSDLLKGTTTLEESVKISRVPNLDFLPAGTFTTTSAELLGSDRLCELLDTLQRDYEFIVIDSAPLLAVTDSLVLAPHVGGVLMVVNMNSNRRMIESASDQLARVDPNVLGVVVADARDGQIVHSDYR